MLFVFGTSFVQSLSTELPFGKLEAIIVGGIVNKCLFYLVPTYSLRNVQSLIFSNYEDWQQR